MIGIVVDSPVTSRTVDPFSIPIRPPKPSAAVEALSTHSPSSFCWLRQPTDAQVRSMRESAVRACVGFVKSESKMPMSLYIPGRGASVVAGRVVFCAVTNAPRSDSSLFSSWGRLMGSSHGRSSGIPARSAQSASAVWRGRLMRMERWSKGRSEVMAAVSAMVRLMSSADRGLALVRSAESPFSVFPPSPVRVAGVMPRASLRSRLVTSTGMLDPTSSAVMRARAFEVYEVSAGSWSSLSSRASWPVEWNVSRLLLSAPAAAGQE